ncbi:ribosomal large subunit pseudouridine synthase B [Geoalkalibacter ferrihydriticus]|uniref:Pseudouridine synthase n=2 Tax=Geoalkalibacter ferrihydriticus TaxID=392333 RepID=A0A0C2DTI4_9BACT|nr:pseudouridine synthase [Geoalkalibacter ferrihydriticus]KIH76759.1 RNA pseudouridine synthase [Geoalkalibacter ferrihydriticus DSM 17813]SDL52978.1 ribosomal large subunit pseudouridine synthase B [Geoalkalibacter ferrihydriticus]
MKERLQKLIAAAGLASRRQAEEWIAAGRVLVNDHVAALGDKADPGSDRIQVNGRLLPRSEDKVYLLLHKPAGYVTTLRDPQGRPIVTDLIKNCAARVFPVGRLDAGTEGLLLLTNDGALAQHLAHPRHKVDKTYLVKVRGRLNEQARERLQQGVDLDDGPTLPAILSQLRFTTGNTWFELTLREGRNRQVRRMCEAVGFPVVRLKRLRIGFLELGSLAAGHYRPLTRAEVARLKDL